MKKTLLLLTLYLTVFTLSACKADHVLTIYFGPSRDAAEILETMDPLKELLLDELANLGYDYDDIDIVVKESYEDVIESMVTGHADIAFLPRDVYVQHANDGWIDVALTATRTGLQVDTEDPLVWNTNEPILDGSTLVPYYYGLLIAGPSTQGRALASKVNSGTALTWADMEATTFCIRSTSSASGYRYPTLWLQDNFSGHTFEDLPSSQVIVTSRFGISMEQLAEQTCDVATIIAGDRDAYSTLWQSMDETGYHMTNTIWEDTDVIGVTAPIYNDTISITKSLIDDELKDAIQTAFINIAQTDEGRDIFELLNHEGYHRAEDSDYDNEREAQALVMD